MEKGKFSKECIWIIILEAKGCKKECSRNNTSHIEYKSYLGRLVKGMGMDIFRANDMDEKNARVDEHVYVELNGSFC